jgi:glycosyltransferase involved in cell wall biosynthesis/ribosomal protein S18 acetylase RimI-like enzyme
VTGSSRSLRVAHIATIDLTHKVLLLGQLRRLRDEGYEVTAISAPGPWVSELEGEGIRFVPWRNATRSVAPIADVRAFGELLSILRRERFDLVHTHTPKAGVMGRLAARLAGVPCVVNTVHGLYATPDDRLAKRVVVLTLEGLAARCSDLELFQSEEDLAWARRRHVVPRGRGVLLGNGTELSRFDPQAIGPDRVAAIRAELGIPREAPVVGTVGRLVAEKGYREFFEAARRLRTSFPDVRFLAVGDQDPAKADVIAPGVQDKVVVTGWRRDVAELLAAMDVFVLASWREGVPRSAIEAGAMGKAMVLTDIRGCREVARNGREALLVPARNAAMLSAAIERLLGDADLRATLGSAARRRVIDRFDMRRVEDIVVERYSELVRRKGLRAVAASGGVGIRRASTADAAVMARLHRDGLPTAFLPSLGDAFLRQLYRAIAGDPQAVALVAEADGGVIGFVAGVPSVRRFSRRFALRHGVRAAIAAGPRLFRRDALRRSLETSRYPAGSGSAIGAELLSIAVEPQWRSRGVGRALADELMRGLGEQGATEVRVVSGAGNGEGAFYRSVGFRPVGHVSVHDGQESEVLVRS